MASLTEHLNKLREDRVAREKARIEKLRELNLKKYNKSEPLTVPRSNHNDTKVEVKKNPPVKILKGHHDIKKRPGTAPVTADPKAIAKQHPSTQQPASKQLPITKHDGDSKFDKPLPKTTESNDKKTSGSTANNKVNVAKTSKQIDKRNTTMIKDVIAKTSKQIERRKAIIPNIDNDKKPTKPTVNGFNGNNKTVNAVKTSDAVKSDPKFSRKSFIPKTETKVDSKVKNARKSFAPPSMVHSASKLPQNRQSVFERLYQPKQAPERKIPDAIKLQTDPNFLKKVIKSSSLITNRRYTVFEPQKIKPAVRRSISAVHFKRIEKSELKNCFHKWSSIGEKLDKVHLKDISEDANVVEDKIISAVKSERKRVKFSTPMLYNFNTPRPEELQARLQNWLKKRGKSIDSFHHLQCFGIQHLAKDIRPLNLESSFNDVDEEDKENRPVDSDSDDDSYEENMNNKVDNTKWRNASCVSDSVDFNESHNTTLTPNSNGTTHHVDEVLIGALSDLTELLKEGFEWEQCARWLRSIRERFPAAGDTAAYWECRAALEERRGDLPASVHCWEQAIAKGTQHSVVEANLDQLLDKFMQLKISPNSGHKKPDPKMVDVKNVFKSTLIRFAVQQAKLRQSQDAKYIVTPVRRSGRLSYLPTSARRTPLQVCSSVRQVEALGHTVLFVPNDKLSRTP